MNKIAFITGASAGIGKACAEVFAREGFNLILTARRIEKLEKLAEEIKEDFDVEVKIIQMDVRIKEDIQKAWDSLSEEWKQVDLLINNAGLSQGLDPIFSGDTDDWDKMIDTNIKGLLYVSRIILPQMKERKSGHVINIGSIAGKEVYPNGNVYCATKHAVDALSKAMRIDLLPYGIKVSALHPGAVETEFSIVRFKGDTERASKVYEGFEPLYAQDIAEAAWFMVSRPPHVTVNDMLIMPTAQANGTLINKQ
jgi:NADP-dependent 3-hydroxy acid dehydrogenase YdfG